MTTAPAMLWKVIGGGDKGDGGDEDKDRMADFDDELAVSNFMGTVEDGDEEDGALSSEVGDTLETYVHTHTHSLVTVPPACCSTRAKKYACAFIVA